MYQVVEAAGIATIEVVAVVAVEARDDGYVYLLASKRLGRLPTETQPKLDRVHQQFIAKRGRKPTPSLAFALIRRGPEDLGATLRHVAPGHWRGLAPRSARRASQSWEHASEGNGRRYHFHAACATNFTRLRQELNAALSSRYVALLP